MPGKRITQQQIRIYMKARQNGKTKQIAAACSGFSERTGYTVEKRDFALSKPTHNWMTRKDSFKAVWGEEIVPLLEDNPHLQAKTLLEEMQRRHPGEYPDFHLRTLQRRVRKWKALSGPEKEIIFRQNHPPGWQGISDFTDGSKLRVTICGEKLEHKFYHYRLVYSKWEAVSVILGGESFTALSEGLQNALWKSGGVPKTHRTDSLSAAYHNCSDKQREDFTKSYSQFCAYYGMEPTRNNKGIAHENGAIEAAHGHLKTRVDQALMLRGSREFSTLTEYKQFIEKIIESHNRRVQKAYMEERACLKELPQRRTTDFSEERARVTTSSTIRVRDVTYSVPSKLIGMILKVHLYDDRLECYLGSDKVDTLTRKRRSKKRVHHIDYRHVIGALKKKPQAFRYYIYREELFPTAIFKQAWEALNQKLNAQQACREYVKILGEAAPDGHEEKVEKFLERQLGRGKLPESIEVERLFKKEVELPKLSPPVNDLQDYNILVGGRK